MSERHEPTAKAHDEERPMLAQLCDIVRYAPIAILLDGPSMLPKLAEQGKVHVGNARFLGRRAIREAEPQLRRLLEGAGAQAGALLQQFGVLPQPPEAPAVRPSRRRQPVPTEPRAATTNGSGDGSRPEAPDGGLSADDLAIPDYDGLSASHVVNRLPGLAADELEAVRAYEAGHRGRKTILNKVAQLQQHPS